MSLRSFNVGPRAAVFFSCILFIVLLLGIVAIIQMDKLRASQQDVETNWMASMRLSEMMNSGALRLRLESLRGTTTPDQKLRQQTIEAYPGYRLAFMNTVEQYEKVIASDEERRLFVDVKKSTDAYAKLLATFEGLLNSGDNAGATELINTSIRPITNTLQEQIGALREYNDRGAKQAGIKAAEIYSTGLILVYGLLAAVLLVTVLLAFLLIRSITVPMSDALAIAQRIANKDLSERIVVTGEDEAARMLTAITEMQNNLRQTISHLADSSTQLASASEEMSAVIEESGRGLVRQNDEVSQAATAVTEMSAAVDEVARNAAEAADASQRSLAITAEGLENVGSTLDSIQNLTGNVSSTSAQVQALSSRAQQISQVVEVIRSIAEQTNLLALNAAIEAARAGEQGRGFAVVADEVRALAHRTQQSTQEIEQMIGGMQSDSLDAVRAMEHSQQMAGESSSVARNANTSLKQIAEAITVINERNTLIATAAEEQAQVAREIDRNLTSIRDLSTQSAAGASQTATASNEVSKLAVGLNTIVRQFIL